MSASKIESGHVPAHALERPASGDSGFTLIEALIALAIFSLAFAGIFRAIEGGWQNVRRAQHTSEAIEVAKAQLAAAGITDPLVEGRREGVTADGVPYMVEIRQRAVGPPQSGSTPPRRPANPAYDVSVSAGRLQADGDRPPAVVLKTIKLGERSP